MRYALVPCLVLTMCGSGLAAPPQPSPAARTQAVKYADQAVQTVGSLAASFPKARVLLFAGVIQGASGHRAAADRLFAQAQATVDGVKPSDANDLARLASGLVKGDFFIEVGVARYRSGDLPGALDTLHNSGSGLYRLVQALIEDRDLANAQRIVSKIDDGDETKALALRAVAAGLATCGTADEAIRVARSVPVPVQRVVACKEVAIALAAAGNPDAARTAARETEMAALLVAQPAQRFRRSDVAIAYGAAGDLARARAMSDDPPMASETWAEIAGAQAAMGDLAAAIRSAELVGIFRGGEVYSNLAISAAAAHDTTTAHRLCQLAVDSVIAGSRSNDFAAFAAQQSIYEVAGNCTKAGDDESVDRVVEFARHANIRSILSISASIASALAGRGDTERAASVLENEPTDDLGVLDALKQIAGAAAARGRTAELRQLRASYPAPISAAAVDIGAAAGLLSLRVGIF